MMPTELTPSQRAHLKALKEWCKWVRIDGYDLADRIVVSRQDKKGYARYSIRPDGSGCDVIEPIVEFTEEDLYEFRGEDFHYMTNLTGINA